MNRFRGFTLVELLVVVGIIALLISILLPALGKAAAESRSVKDGTQIKEIHQAMNTFALSNNGRYPIPGLINRLADPELGQSPNLGPEDFVLNHSSHFYSSMIAQQLISPSILIGPTEVNPKFVVKEDYNYDTYDPGSDRYWDPTFKAYLKPRSNSSYAHLSICGKRKKESWRASSSPNMPMIGTRAPGIAPSTSIINPDDPSYTHSQTLLLHSPSRLWSGNVCFNDNRVQRLDSMYAPAGGYEHNGAPPARDFMYAAEFGDGTVLDNHSQADAFLSISKTASSDGKAVGPVFEPLLDD